MEKWNQWRNSFRLFLAAGALLGGGVAYWFWMLPGVVALEAMILCLALGFWITEMLIGVFAAVKKANGSALVLLFGGKIAWWAGLFFGIRMIPNGVEGAVGLGIGIFLGALLLAGLRHYGMPRISDGNPPSDP